MDDQCALGSDRQLLDKSEIFWHHDPDDPTPIIAPATGTAPTHPFFTGGSSPSVVAASSHHSGRVSKPSKHVLDADNAKRAEGSKRPRASRCVVIVESDTADDSKGPSRLEYIDGNNVTLAIWLDRDTNKNSVQVGLDGVDTDEKKQGLTLMWIQRW